MIFEIENFLSADICSSVINYFDNTTDRNTHITGYFSDKSLSPYNIKDRNILKELIIFQTKSLQIISRLYHPNELNINLFLEYWDIVRWDVGKDMEVHQDGMNYEYSRDYSSVCYLNDTYIGGETFFPERKYVCKPKQGKIVFFPSTLYHGVKVIKQGIRYTLPCWYSKNANDILLPQISQFL